MFSSNIDIKKIKSIQELAPLFSVSDKMLKSFVSSNEEFIKHAVLLKKSGDYRKIVCIKDDPFKHYLKLLAQFLYSWYSLHIPKSVHGFIKNRSIITNAQQHTQKKIVLNVDIKDFFNSISSAEVKRVFISIGFHANIAEALTRTITVNDALATGFPTSPTVSNIVCIIMDRVFESVCEKRGITYTRYADDLTFSSNDKILTIKNIQEILGKFGFDINQKKTRIYRRGGPQYVTGLTVVDKKPRLSKKLKRLLRLEAYYIKKYSFRNHLGRSLKDALEKERWPGKLTEMAYHGYGLEGFISYVQSVEPKLAKRMWAAFPKIKTSNNHLEY